MLENTLFRLKHEKKLRIGYFGGSITDGTGSSDADTKSYRSQVTRHLRETYPACEITELNAAIGGTGTGLGMFRCERDLLFFKPDLIFMEFAANDFGDRYENVLAHSEAIFRKIRSKFPLSDIVTIFTSYESIMKTLESGGEYGSRSAQTAAGHYYGVARIDAGEALRSHYMRSGLDYTDYMPDRVHPNDTGHKILADCIWARLSEMLENAEKTTGLVPYKMPQRLTDVNFDNARTVPCRELDGLKTNGFTFADAPSGERFTECLEGKAGNRFSFTFNGEGLGFYWTGGGISADAFVSIDGGEQIRAVSWDHFDRSFDKISAAVFAEGLNRGEHTVTVTADEGALVRISAVMIY